MDFSNKFLVPQKKPPDCVDEVDQESKMSHVLVVIIHNKQLDLRINKMQLGRPLF